MDDIDNAKTTLLGIHRNEQQQDDDGISYQSSNNNNASEYAPTARIAMLMCK